MESNVIAVRTVNLCIIKHSIGDAFSIEHIYPTLLLEFECTKSLLVMPGVFVLTFDNCEYGNTPAPTVPDHQPALAGVVESRLFGYACARAAVGCWSPNGDGVAVCAGIGQTLGTFV
jgi:hypothetical protein